MSSIYEDWSWDLPRTRGSTIGFILLILVRCLERLLSCGWLWWHWSAARWLAIWLSNVTTLRPPACCCWSSSRCTRGYGSSRGREDFERAIRGWRARVVLRSGKLIFFESNCSGCRDRLESLICSWVLVSLHSWFILRWRWGLSSNYWSRSTRRPKNHT